MSKKLHVTRRELVVSAGVTGALAAVPPAWGKSLMSRRARVGPGAFRDGVATGEPTSKAITFWSRLTTERPRSGARLVIAKDPGMRKVVATAIVPTGNGVDGALKARVGGLKPQTEYFYAWESGTAVSEIGRTRTAPAPGSAKRLRMAFSSCQQYTAGFFGAHAHAATLPDLDLYLFLGDYVYEKPSFDPVRRDPFLAVDLSSYRQKYALYRSDKGLRELHRMHATAHIWDDHELSNNYSGEDPPPPALQRAAAYRAAFEWLPRMTMPAERHRIYKRLSYGTVADVFLLDERQYRIPGGPGRPRRMLGDAQMGWLLDQLRKSRATWKVLAHQVVMAQRQPGEADNQPDSWDGYVDDRAFLLREIERAGIQNVVFLTGDAHVFMASTLASDFQALGEGRARSSAVEYVGGSVTSPGRDISEAEVRDTAPWIQQYNGGRRGYAELEALPDSLAVAYVSNPVFSPQPQPTLFDRFYQQVNTNQMSRERVAPRRV
jgi:phosphodiesterase/alkaline phosphatase D-like protein